MNDMRIYRAKWVVPIDRPPIADGAIAVENGRIARIGPAAELGGTGTHDLGECVLLPGFVNAHTHLEFTGYRGRLEPAPLWDWFSRLMMMRLLPGAIEHERIAMLAGARESLAAGVTCVGDISRSGLHWRELPASPIRKVCFLELISGAREVPNDAASLTDVLCQVRPQTRPPGFNVGISPHALYTVTEPDLTAAAQMAVQYDLPLTMHLLETEEEAEWLRGEGDFLRELLERTRLPTAKEKTTGRATERLRRCGLLSSKSLFAHVNYIDDEELKVLAAARAGVAWCPRSHDFFAHAKHRWRDMLDEGINVCLGTDSLASNETLSILDEARFVRRRVGDFPPERLLAMATLNGAAALGLDREIGSLTIGKLADFVAVSWDTTGPITPEANVLDGNGTIRGVWIEGVPVV